MQYLVSPVNKMRPNVVYVILVITGIINVVIVNYSYYMGDYFENYNLIDLELAGSVINSNIILDYWKDLEVINWVYFHLGLDFLFMITYSVFLFFGCHTSALQLKSFPFFIHLGLVIGWMQPLAGILDFIENYSLLHVLSGTTDDFWPQLAGWCAMPKFAIALSGLAYCVIALVISTTTSILLKDK